MPPRRHTAGLTHSHTVSSLVLLRCMSCSLICACDGPGDSPFLGELRDTDPFSGTRHRMPATIPKGDSDCGNAIRRDPGVWPFDGDCTYLRGLDWRHEF